MIDTGMRGNQHWTDRGEQWQLQTWHVDEGEVGDVRGKYCQLNGLRRHCAALPFEVPVGLCLNLIPDGLCSHMRKHLGYAQGFQCDMPLAANMCPQGSREHS